MTRHTAALAAQADRGGVARRPGRTAAVVLIVGEERWRRRQAVARLLEEAGHPDPSERHHFEAPEDEIRERYFQGLTSRVEKDTLLEYVRLSVAALEVSRSEPVQKFLKDNVARALNEARTTDPELVAGYLLASNALDRLFTYINTHEESLDMILESYLASAELFVEGVYHKWGTSSQGGGQDKPDNERKPIKD